MNMNTTFTAEQIQTLIAAGIDLNEFFASAPAVPAVAKPVTQPKAAPKKDGRNKAARAANHQARMVRRESTTLGGLKKAERRELAAILRAELGRNFTPEEWTANVAAYKAGEFTLVDFS